MNSLRIWSVTKRLNSDVLVCPTTAARMAALIRLTKRKARVSLSLSERMGYLSRFGAEAIADAKDGLDIAGVAGVRLQLGPQVADVHVDGALHALEGDARQLLQQAWRG